MIVDRIDRLRQYAAVYPGLEKAADFLETLDPHIPAGKYPIIGSRIYAVVQRYETRPEEELLWECHNRYLDLQCLLFGQETILFADRDTLTDCTAYDETKDSIVSGCRCPSAPLPLHAGQFVLLTPRDAHKPKCIFSHPSQVTKVVIKYALSPGCKE